MDMAFFLADKANTRRVKGRGTTQNPSARFLQEEREVFYDGWQTEISEESKLKTHVTIEHPKSIITRNHSPDLPFDRSINPIAAVNTVAFTVLRGRHTLYGSFSRRRF